MSLWLEIVQLASKRAYDVIKVLKQIFSTHGIPSTLISDNMPFSSYEFKLFAKEWDFTIVTSGPHYSKSNGFAERGVQIAKNILRKNTDLSIALLEYRTTPLTKINVAPCQLLYSRRIKTKLPISDKLLEPKTLNFNDINEKLKQKREQEVS